MTYEAMTNEDRAKQVGIALQAFAKATGLKESEDGAETIAGDMIAGILHWVASRSPADGRLDVLHALRSGIGHYVSEHYGEIEGEELGPESIVLITVDCNGDHWHSETSVGESIEPLEAATCSCT